MKLYLLSTNSSKKPGPSHINIYHSFAFIFQRSMILKNVRERVLNMPTVKECWLVALRECWIWLQRKSIEYTCSERVLNTPTENDEYAAYRERMLKMPVVKECWICPLRKSAEYAYSERVLNMSSVKRVLIDLYQRMLNMPALKECWLCLQWKSVDLTHGRGNDYH